MTTARKAYEAAESYQMEGVQATPSQVDMAQTAEQSPAVHGIVPAPEVIGQDSPLNGMEDVPTVQNEEQAMQAPDLSLESFIPNDLVVVSRAPSRRLSLGWMRC